MASEAAVASGAQSEALSKGTVQSAAAEGGGPSDGGRMVPERRRSPLHGSKTSFGIFLGAILTGGLIGILLLNTNVNTDAFTLHNLERQSARLTEQEEAAAARVDLLSAPDAMMRRAAALGMVPNQTPAFLRLADGRILGVPTPASAPPTPPAAQAAPSQGAQAPGTQSPASPDPAAQIPIAQPAADPAAQPTPTANQGVAP